MPLPHLPLTLLVLYARMLVCSYVYAVNTTTRYNIFSYFLFYLVVPFLYIKPYRTRSKEVSGVPLTHAVHAHRFPWTEIGKKKTGVFPPQNQGVLSS